MIPPNEMTPDGAGKLALVLSLLGHTNASEAAELMATAWAADRTRIEELEKENLGLLDAAVKAAERGEEER